MLLPTSCPLCSAIGPAPCQRCERSIAPPAPMRRPPHLTSVAAIASFDGAGRDLVLGLKYANRRDALPWMARQLVRIAPADIDLVTHVPTTVSRRGRRGFDQAAALTRAMRAELGKPQRRLLTRRGTDHQTGQSAAARRQGPSFTARPVRGLRILLVDDVMTTGATLSAAAKALRSAGAAEVHAVVVAYTPPRAIRRRKRSQRASLPPMV